MIQFLEEELHYQLFNGRATIAKYCCYSICSLINLLHIHRPWNFHFPEEEFSKNIQLVRSFWANINVYSDPRE